MKNLLGFTIGVREIFPYFMIIIIYFLIINLEDIRTQKNQLRINQLDNDLDIGSDNSDKANHTTSTVSKRIPITVLPFKND